MREEGVRRGRTSGAVGFGRVGEEFIRRVGESGPSDLEIDGP